MAAADQLAERGAGEASARSIAAAAGFAASAINYNFGSIEHLFSTAFERGATLTADWLEGREQEIAALPKTAGAAVLALERVIVQWTQNARPLALLYQECLAVMAGRGPAAAWTGLWRDFWLRTAAGLGLGATEGRLMHLIFESEALYHLSNWSPALEEGALREISAHFGTIWLGAPAAPVVGMLDLAERAAGVRAIGSIPPSAFRIVEAAAAVVEERGLGGLTHRAVAAQAGVTTGAVTYHFRTIEDLLAGAIRGQVQALESASAAEGVASAVLPPRIDTPEQFFKVARAFAIADRPAGPALARRRLFLAAVRRPGLASSGAVIRFAHGGTARDALRRLFPIKSPMLSLHAGVLSRLLASIWFACSADSVSGASRESLADDVLAGFSRAAESA